MEVFLDLVLRRLTIQREQFQSLGEAVGCLYDPVAQPPDLVEQSAHVPLQHVHVCASTLFTCLNGRRSLFPFGAYLPVTVGTRLAVGLLVTDFTSFQIVPEQSLFSFLPGQIEPVNVELDLGGGIIGGLEVDVEETRECEVILKGRLWPEGAAYGEGLDAVVGHVVLGPAFGAFERPVQGVDAALEARVAEGVVAGQELRLPTSIAKCLLTREPGGPLMTECFVVVRPWGHELLVSAGQGGSEKACLHKMVTAGRWQPAAL